MALIVTHSESNLNVSQKLGAKCSTMWMNKAPQWRIDNTSLQKKNRAVLFLGMLNPKMTFVIERHVF